MTLEEEAKRKLGAVPEGYDEISVEFFQFKNMGDNLQGRLIQKGRTNVRGGRDVPNQVGKYTLMKADSQKVTFLGGVHLDELMSNIAIGAEVYIKYTHNEKTESDFDLKKFKVYVKTNRS